MPAPAWLGDVSAFSERVPGVFIPGQGPGDGHASVPPVPSANGKTSPQLPWPQHPQSYIHQLRISKTNKKQKGKSCRCQLPPPKSQKAKTLVPAAWF